MDCSTLDPFCDYVDDLMRAINSTIRRVSDSAKLHRGINARRVLVNLFFLQQNRYVLHDEWCNGACIELRVPAICPIELNRRRSDGRRSRSFPAVSLAVTHREKYYSDCRMIYTLMKAMVRTTVPHFAILPCVTSILRNLCASPQNNNLL